MAPGVQTHNNNFSGITTQAGVIKHSSQEICQHLGSRPPTFHSHVVHRQLQALATPDHPHRVPLIVIELVPRKERLGAFTCSTKGEVRTAQHIAPGRRQPACTRTHSTSSTHQSVCPVPHTWSHKPHPVLALCVTAEDIIGYRMVVMNGHTFLCSPKDLQCDTGS